jgi:DNA invertase Pin-like site-specific DNA recombinase
LWSGFCSAEAENRAKPQAGKTSLDIHQGVDMKKKKIYLPDDIVDLCHKNGVRAMSNELGIKRSTLYNRLNALPGWKSKNHFNPLKKNSINIDRFHWIFTRAWV